MDENKVLEVLALYRKELKHRGYKGRRFIHQDRAPERSESLAHCYYMATKVINGMKLKKGDRNFFSIGKAKRWLGFIQGALWMNGVYTIDEVREHNHPQEEP